MVRMRISSLKQCKTLGPAVPDIVRSPILSNTSVPSLSLPLHLRPSSPPRYIRKPHRIWCTPQPSLPLRLPPPVNRPIPPHPRHTRNTHQSRVSHQQNLPETQQRNMQGAMP
jgi:hypothetical protein